MALKQETAISILQAYRAKFDDVIDAYGTRKFNQATKSNNTDYKTKFKKHCHHIKQSIDSELEKSDQGIEINCQSIVNDIFKLQEQYEHYFYQTQERKANCCLFFKHSMNRSFLHLYNKHLSRVTHFVEKVIQSECASFISQKGNICEKAHVSTILNFICNQKTNNALYRHSVMRTPFEKDFTRVESKLDSIMGSIKDNMHSLQAEGLSKKQSHYSDMYLELATLQIE